MVKHAFLSASASQRWLNCPPSAKLNAGIADRASPYAQEGTDCHTLCAYLVEKALGRDSWIRQKASPTTAKRCRAVQRATGITFSSNMSALRSIAPTR